MTLLVRRDDHRSNERSVRLCIAMIALGVLSCVGAACSSGGSDGDQESPELAIAAYDELDSVYPDTDPSDGVNFLRLDTPRGSRPGFIVVLATSSPTLAIDPVVEADIPATVAEMLDVPVERNTGEQGYVLGSADTPAPWAVRDAPFRIYEAIKPLHASLSGRSQYALYVQLDVGAAVRPGTHPVRLTVTSGAAHRTVTAEIEVHGAVVPSDCSHEFPSTTWINVDQIVSRHGFAEFSEGYWATLERYAAVMRQGGQNMVLLPWRVMFDRGTEPDAPPWLLAPDRIDRFVRIFADAGFCWFEGGHWATGSLLAGELRLNTGAVWGEPAAQSFVRQNFAEQLFPYLVDRGLVGRWVQHIADEPGSSTAVAYSEAARELRVAMPGIRILDAVKTHDIDPSALDVWVADVVDYQRSRDFYARLQQTGNEVWVYTLLFPGGDWVNRLIDLERVRSTYIAWSIVKFDLDGFLHWGLNQWFDYDPYERSVIPLDTLPIDLPAGDPWILYPGPGSEVYSSARWEAFRLGMEDYKLLRILEQHDPAHAARIIDAVFTDFATFEKTFQRYREVRRELIEAAEGSGG